MGLTTFERRLELPHDSSEVYAWHVRPGAFARLSPPWDRVTLTSSPAEIRPGASQSMIVRLGPLRCPWVSAITDVEPGSGFRDVQTTGPFARWEHEHRVESRGAGRATLVDRIEYTLPLGVLGRVFGARGVRRRLERIFAYRHRVTASDLARHAPLVNRPPLDVLVSGASGMVGSALTAFLTSGGHRVRRLVRREREGPDEFRWDPAAGEIDSRAVEGADAVVHLAGENIAGRRWSARQKEAILRSRIEGTRLLVDAVRGAQRPPGAFISASAVGWYGDRGDELLDEASAPGEGFLAEVCRGWESASAPLAGTRRVALRFGVILSPAGGALQKLLLPFRMGVGGPVGNGRQWMSWISLDDAVGVLHRALVDDRLEGAVNAVAPAPVTSAEFARTLGGVLRRPAIAPLPGSVARIAFGELADELLLASQRADSKRLRESGFAFDHPQLDGALQHMLGREAARE